MSRVLVTGATGYIGSVLVPYFERAGFEVSTLDLGLYREARFPAEELSADRRDIRTATVADLEGYDVVVHLAALSNDPLGDLDPSLTYDINHQSTTRFAELAKQAGVARFIFASSCSLYGAAGEHFVDESAAFAPVTPYAESKVRVEADLRRLASDDFSPTYMRNATVYGLSPALRLDVVVNNLTAWAVATGTVKLLSDGTPWRPQVHVEDVARVAAGIAKAPLDLVHDEAFNVGRTDENYQIRDLAEIVAQVVPGAELSISDAAGPDTRSYRVSFDKLAQTLPDSVPVWTVQKGAEQLAEAFKAAELQEGDFGRYTRLAEIRRLIAAGRLTEELTWLN